MHAFRSDTDRRRSGGLINAKRLAHVVEGKLLTSREIAEHLGVSADVALRRAKRGPFPLTWARLQSSGMPR